MQGQLDRLEALLLRVTGGQAPAASGGTQVASGGDGAAASTLAVAQE